MHLLKKFIIRAKSFIYLSILFFFLIPFISFAAWDGSPYAPGSTLTPECTPSDVNCTVSTMPVSLGGTGLNALKSGYIPFGAGTGAFATSSALYFDSINERLGIGTTSPSTILSLGDTGSNTVNISTTATSTFGYSINLRSGCFAIDGACVPDALSIMSSISSAYPFQLTGNATSTLTQFNGGLTAYASSTIGNGTQIGGLTIFGGATTTGSAYFAGNIGVGISSASYKLDVAGIINVDRFSSYKQDGNTVLYASTTNTSLAIGAPEAAAWMGSSSSQWYSVAIGSGALATSPISTAPQENTAVGRNALNANLTGYSNVAMGNGALFRNLSGGNNSGLGAYALGSNTLGFYNTAQGYASLYNLSGVNHDNVAFGYNAGRFQANGSTALASTSRSIYIGSGVMGFSNSDVNSIVIGYQAKGIGANSVVLGNDSVTTTLLKGNIGIGSTSPYAKLSISANDGEIYTSLFTIASSTFSTTSTLFTVLNNGNVGIGTSFANRLLTVASDSPSTTPAGYFSVASMLLGQNEGGAYFGRVGLTENQWGLSDHGTSTWNTRDSSRVWHGVAMSSDGKIQTATVESGQIYVSSDYGTTWTAKASSLNWRGVAMSSDGKIQTAVVHNGQIYISSDYGSTWTAKDSSRTWRRVAMSSDGKIQTAVTISGYIYTSSDYGSTWTAKGSSLDWFGIAMSSDGKIQTAVAFNNNVYVSSDYGSTWTAKDSSRTWNGIAMSADGKIQTAVVGGGQIYISSNYGSTWTAKASVLYWNGIAMSADGKIQTAVVYNTPGYIYVSADYGATWTSTGADRYWSSVAMSSDGKIQTVVPDTNNLVISFANSYIMGGNIGIGTASPNQGKVEVKGGSVCVDTNSDDNASSCIASESDERLKENIQPLSASVSLETILSLNPVSFDWRATDPEVLAHYPLIGRYASSTHSIGLIAQQVAPFVPEAIGTETVGDSEVQYFQLDYTKFIPHLIGAIKELWSTIAGFANRFTTQELCVGSTCVTEDQFKAMVEATGRQLDNSEQNQ